MDSKIVKRQLKGFQVFHELCEEAGTSLEKKTGEKDRNENY